MAKNLLFLFTDEQRADTMRAYGNERIETPRLDALARDSVVFEKCYVTQPVCTPSRSSIMTGLYPHANGCTRNNVPLAPDTPCIAEMLPGYATGYFGKWHLGDEIFAQHGFQTWVSIEDMYAKHYRSGRDRNARSTYHHWLASKGYVPERKDGGPGVFTRGQAAGLPEEHCKPAFLAEQVCAWLENQGGQPFAAYVNFLEPHMPFTGPRDGQYPHGETVLPPNHNAPPGAANHPKPRLLHGRYAQGYGDFPLDGEASWRHLIAQYWGLVSQVDAAVGRILDALDRHGLAEDTIVVYTSDHGDMMGSHQLLAKCVMYEETVTVPLLMRVPGVTPRLERTRVSQVDLVPTLLDLMGREAPATLQGQSLRPLLADGQPPRERHVFIEWNGPDCGGGHSLLAALAGGEAQRDAILEDPVRTVIGPDGWKLNYSPRTGMHELFNLDADPLEMDNLAQRPACKPVFDALKQRLKAWGAAKGDKTAAAI